jgi:type I restriction enzyme S subunit
VTWPMVPLEELCVFIRNGKSIQQTKDVDGLPVTRIETIANQTIDPARFGYEGLTESDVGGYLLEPDDILFSHINSLEHLSKCAQYEGVPEKLVHGMNLLNIRSNRAVADSRYVLHMLRAPEQKAKFLRIANKSVNQASISSGNLKKVSVPLPPLSDQRRIAAILDKADALRAKRREAIAKLDQLLQSVFLEMFGDPVANPKGWPVVSVQDACKSIVDCVNRTAPVVNYATNFKMIRTTNVRNFKVDLSSVRFVEKAVFDSWNRRLQPRRGDVILTREAPAGEAGILDSDDNVFLGQRLMLYRVDELRATPHYLLYSFMGSGLQQQFKKKSSGSTVKHLSVPDCRAWELVLPPIRQQEKFSEIAKKGWDMSQKGLTNGGALEDLFSTIQKRAFSGTL